MPQHLCVEKLLAQVNPKQFFKFKNTKLKFNYLILLILFFTSCKSTKIISEQDLIGCQIETGKCYYSVLKKENNKASNDFNSEGFLLEIIEAEYKTIERKATVEEIKNFPNDNSPFRLEIRKPSYKVHLKNKPIFDFISDRDQYGLILCGVEMPGSYRTMTLDKLKQDNYIYEYEKVKTPQRIIKRKVKSEPKNLKDNQFYFSKGDWLEFKEVILPSHYGQRTNLVKQVQIKLKERGYDVEINNILDKKTKSAILKFQRKNNIPSVDSEILKELGIEGY